MEGEEENQRELQLLPSPSSSTHLSAWKSSSSGSSRSTKANPFLGSSSSLDLQLSISLQPLRPPSNCVIARPLCRYEDKKIDLSCIEALKWQAAEQIRLASIEKAYAERVREMTRREMELAKSEFAIAREMWERARIEMENVERLKERATRQIDSTSMEITCQTCRQRFRS